MQMASSLSCNSPVTVYHDAGNSKRSVRAKRTCKSQARLLARAPSPEHSMPAQHSAVREPACSFAGLRCSCGALPAGAGVQVRTAVFSPC